MFTPADHFLGTRSIFILPTRAGWLFGLMLVALLIGAVNYNNALAYLLTFLLASLAVVSLLHTQRNLLHLRITVAGSEPVFAGDIAQFRVCLQNTARARHAVRVRPAHGQPLQLDVPARDTHCGELSVPTLTRGWLTCPALTLSTEYPLGITHAWTRKLTLAARVLVYPAPAPEALLLPQQARDDGSAHAVAAHDGDDFSGVRAYQTGDALSRLNWKTLAHGQGLTTKEFAILHGDECVIDWQDFAPLEVEPRLSAMSRALLDAERDGRLYGLALPGVHHASGRGREHLHHCLEALALYEHHG
jgi:uncharacterized protein (DUF58 family)